MTNNNSLFQREINAFRFFKLIDSDIYRQGKRNMMLVIKSIQQLGYINEIYLRPFRPDENEGEKMSKTEKRDFETDFNIGNKKNESLFEKIKSMCCDHIAQAINLEYDVKKLGDGLESRYQFKKGANKGSIMNRFEQLSYLNCKNVQEFDNKFQTLVKKATDMNIILNDGYVIKTLNCLRPSFEFYIILISAESRVKSELPILKKLIINIKQKESRLTNQKINFNRVDDEDDRNDRSEKQQKDDDREDRGGGRENDQSSNDFFDERDTDDKNDDDQKKSCKFCYTDHVSDMKNCPDKNAICGNSMCDKKKHKSQNCRKKEGGRYKQSINNNFENQPTTSKKHLAMISANNSAFSLTEERIILNKLEFLDVAIGILDSEATCHCTSNKALFRKLIGYSEIANIVSDESLFIKEVEVVPIKLSTDDVLLLRNTMFISTLIVNLISLSKIHNDDYDIIYPTEKPCAIYKNQEFITNADLIHDLYRLRTEGVSNSDESIIVLKSATELLKSTETSVFSFVKTVVDIKTGHRRLVHLEYRNVIANSKKIINMKSIHESTSNELCESCMQRRQQTERFNSSRTKTTTFLERINVDISVDLPLISRGNRIFVLIKNDVTDMMGGRPCKHKSEIFIIVIEFKTGIENQRFEKIKLIRVDDELQINNFMKGLKETDIQGKQSSSYTSDQNAVIERIMYTIMKAIKSIMKNIKLSKGLGNLIDEAMIYIKNKTITVSESDQSIYIFY